MEQYFTLINWDSIGDILKALVAIGAGGGVMSLITSALVGSNWPSPAKQMVAFLTCLVRAFIPVVVAGVELTNMAIVLPLMWVGSQVFYKAWFKPSGLAPWIETLFFNTSEERLSCFDRVRGSGSVPADRAPVRGPQFHPCGALASRHSSPEWTR